MASYSEQKMESVCSCKPLLVTVHISILLHDVITQNISVTMKSSYECAFCTPLASAVARNLSAMNVLIKGY